MTVAHRASRSNRRWRPIAVVGALAVAAGLLAPAGPAGASEIYPAPGSGVWSVVGNGNGHGHGLTQYGARGAAIAGLSSTAILNFFYPGTSLVAKPSSTGIRVLLGDDGGLTTVVAAAGMTVTGVSGALPVTGVRQYRLVPQSSGLTLQKLPTSGGWVNAGLPALPARADFASSSGVVRLVTFNGATPNGFADYRGTVGAVRSSSGELTINRLALDDYAVGVIPREMPSYWQAAALAAQAVAVRSYARYAIENNGASLYDICDSSNCQVYGGKARYDTAGNRLYGEEASTNAAVAATANQVLTYAGNTIFAQFSASDGGYTVDGGQPYLVSKPDPYDNAASGDPWLGWTRTVNASDVAAHFGLVRLTQLEITQRDGHGEWGGRVLAGYVSGTDSVGAGHHIPVTGFDLQDAMNLPHNWFRIVSVPPGPPTSVTATPADAAALIAWQPPTASGSDPVTSFRISLAGRPDVVVGASTRSTWLGGLVNGVRVTASVRAVSSSGASAPVSVAVTPTAAPQPVVPVQPARLVDTAVRGITVDATHPLVYGVPGHGSIPTDPAVKAVQLALTVVGSTNGTLRVYTDGAPSPASVAIAYRSGQPVSATVSVPLVSSGRVVFAPSTGSVQLGIDQMSYSHVGGSAVTSVAPSTIALMSSIPTGAGRTLAVRGHGGVPTDATAAVLSLVLTTSGHSGGLRMWADGAAVPSAAQLSVSSDGKGGGTVIVPIGADGGVRLASTAALLGAAVTVVGYLGPAASGRGLLESVPLTEIAHGRIGASTMPIPTLGKPQVPVSGVRAALVQISIQAAPSAGRLWAWAAGTKPTFEMMRFPASVTVTATALVPLGPDGAFRVATDGASVIIAVDLVGYVTTG